MRTMNRVILALVLLASVYGQPVLAKDSYGSQAGWGAAALFANLVYMPAKLVYATLGGITGALAYPITVGNTEVVESIWSPSLGGTYVLTPRMLRGDERIYFSGESR